MSRELTERIKAVKEAGGKVLFSDFGLSAIAIFDNKKFWLSQCFRSIRDGYEGHRIITIKKLKEKIGFLSKEHK